MLVRHVLCLALGLAACSGGSPSAVRNDHILLAAGMVPLQPLAVDTVSPEVDLGRLGIDNVARAYSVTTPPGTSFSINVLARAPGSGGRVRVCVAHGADGGATPSGGPESLGLAGIVPSGHDPAVDGPWLEVNGMGYARIGISGAIDVDQVLAVCAETDEGSAVVLLRIELGEESIINGNGPDAPVEDGDPAVLQTATLYASLLELLAAPVVASDGDITTVIAYDGNPADTEDWNTYEVRLRHDTATNRVVGESTTPLGDEEWFGEWRDHEVAARGNVLAVATARDERVSLRISFDGGTTFPHVSNVPSGYDGWSFRLAQVALGPSYEIALLFWRVNFDDSCDLVLIEGMPSARDAAGAPTGYQLGGERVLFHGDDLTGPVFSNEAFDFIPLLIGAQYSEGGDLVVAYGYTAFVETGDELTGTTETHCVTRLAGTGVYRDTMVEHEDDVIGFDPSVSVLGRGATMSVFVAYEASDGVRMRVSTDGGLGFSEVTVAGGPGAHLPTVLARVQDGATRVDMLYVTESESGNELHVRHWNDFGRLPPRDYRIAGAGSEGVLQEGIPGEPGYVPGTYVEKQVSWFGYDATLSGDDVVVAYVEEMTDYYWTSAPEEIEGGPLPPPDPLYVRTLKLVRLD